MAQPNRSNGSGAKQVGLLKNSLVTLVGVGFFFAIVGVFGLSASITSLAAFIAVGIWIFANSKQLPDAGR
jgi:amino acid transporter